MKTLIFYILLFAAACISCTKEETCEFVYNSNGDLIGERCWYGEKQPRKIECHGYYKGIGCGQ